MLVSIRHDMAKEIPRVFARRARLSSKAIVTAIALTLAALAAIAVASHEDRKTSVKELGPVTEISVEPESVLVPVVNR
jgi:hypothetical protein